MPYDRQLSVYSSALSMIGELAEKYTTGNADITVRILDHAAELIPDIKRTISVGI